MDDKNPILNESLALFYTNTRHPRRNPEGRALSPERRRAPFMEPPASPRCDKLGPTSGIGHGNVFSASRVTLLAFQPNFYLLYSSSAGRSAGGAGRCRLLLLQSGPWSIKSEGKFSIILLTFRA